MDEYISKIDAANAVCSGCDEEFLRVQKGECNPDTCKILSKLKSLPAADVRPVVYGEWEIVEERINELPCGGSVAIRHRRCSACKQPMGFQKENFCGNCGADMRGEGDEQKH